MTPLCVAGGGQPPMDDFRVKFSWFGHFKRERLRRALGDKGEVALWRLWYFVAANRTDGRLTQMDTEAIAIAAGWLDDPETFIAALVKIRLLDLEEGIYVIHDWEEHNPWAFGFRERSARARKGGIASGESRRKKAEAKQTNSNEQPVEQVVHSSSTPSPSPSPSPLPTPTHKHRASAEQAPAAAAPAVCVDSDEDQDEDPEPAPTPSLESVSKMLGTPIKLISAEDAERLDRSLASRPEEMTLSRIEEALCGPPTTAGPVPHAKIWPTMGAYELSSLVPVPRDKLATFAAAVDATEKACGTPNWRYLRKAFEGKLKNTTPVQQPERAGCNGSNETWRKPPPPGRVTPPSEAFRWLAQMQGAA
jgi:hypothetical protein